MQLSRYRLQNDIKFYRPKSRVYIACEDMNLAFTKNEVWMIKQGWKEGKTVKEIAEQMGRDPDEVLICLISLGHEGEIEQRDKPFWKRRESE